ncbi:glucose-1-phosphate adenylyltransferase subunit GlgD [Papillibacter cinnamivorans]|uniref:Glucose-1-phosphate adenylyltransferase n=1 Tax=Papillibacter cinnamivorans DSM 12816 TaxID=1122930 RepID=A0A1W2A5W9_9FIRM|nr:glucose-1-phosphate adenylyltransferase subunit GlgD [Papillibacter cinnamivorans]SMC55821.1 glucose-1-phosphate adenylyltransferase [Papillibacter cinnamivorans DSM 12816]
MNDMHGILFAYSAGSRLQQLVEHRTTSSLPFAGRYRLIDFMLSNMVNSGIPDIGVIMHENYQSLLDHLGSGKDWDLSRKHGGLKLLPPFAYTGNGRQGGYRGKLEALSGVYSYLEKIRQEYVVLANGDMAVNLPLEKVLKAHLDHCADITAVCTRRTRGTPAESTYFSLLPDGRITDTACGHYQEGSFESLDVYILSKSLLLNLVDYCSGHNQYSFEQDVMQRMRESLLLYGYEWDGYAARFQCIADYYTKSMELLDPRIRQELFCRDRNIRTRDYSNPSTYYGPDSSCQNSLISDGCLIEGRAENSILFRSVVIEPGATVTNCVLMQGTRVQSGAVMKYVIADKRVTVHSGRVLIGHETYPLAISKGSVI